MPRTNNQSSVQQWSVQVGGSNTQVCPNVPSRNLLHLRNKGANACELRFGNPCVGDDNSYDLQPGADVMYDSLVPVNAINLRCSTDGGTVVVIIEGKEIA